MTQNKDQFGRHVTYLRVSLTDYCNLKCQYCMPHDGEHLMDQLSKDQLLRIISVGASEGINKIRLTGGEPLCRKDIVDIVKGINEIKGIDEICLTTNGVLLERLAQPLKLAGLDRLNISLDSLDAETYHTLTRGGQLSKVIAGIKAASEAGFTGIKVNSVLIGGVNDQEVDQFMLLAKEYALDWRLIELMPVGQVAHWAKEKFVSGNKVLGDNPSLERLPFEEGQRVKFYYNKSLDVKIGLIDAMTGKFCNSCNRLRLTSDGRFKPCLHNDQEIDLKAVLDDEEAIRSFFHKSIVCKPEGHDMTSTDYQPISRNMNQVGG